MLMLLKFGKIIALGVQLLFSLPDALCKVASILTSSLPDTEFLSSSIVAFICCNKTWSLSSHLGALHSVFLCVWDTVLLPSPANEQMGMYSSAYLQTGPPSTYLGPCHWSLTDANGQIGLPSKHQEGRWETRDIMCMDLKAHIPILPVSFMSTETPPYLFKFFKFPFKGLLHNDRSTSHFLIPDNSFHNN